MIITEGRFPVLEPSEGMKLTKWREGIDDIIDYIGCDLIRCPSMAMAKRIREITMEKHLELEALREAEEKRRFEEDAATEGPSDYYESIPDTASGL